MQEIDAKKIVSLFEQVLITIMIENYDLKQMFTMDACSIWLPLMCFCKINNLPYSCKYLQLCAESNQWLMYLIFAQLYQIPRYQVISSLEYFNDIGLKQHLEYALHNVINSTTTAATTNQDSIKKIRNRLYTMIPSSNWFKTKSSSSKKKSKKSTKPKISG